MICRCVGIQLLSRPRQVAYWPAQILKTKIVSQKRNFFSQFLSEVFFTRGGCVSCLGGCLGSMLLPQSYPNLSGRRSRTASVDSYAEIKSTGLSEGPYCDHFWQSLEEGAGKRCLEGGSECDGGPDGWVRPRRPAERLTVSQYKSECYYYSN